MKRLIWILAPLLTFFALLYFAQLHFMPKFEKWALVKLQTYSQAELPVIITAERISFRILPPVLRAHDIRITPQTDDLKFLKPIKVASLDLRMDFLQLLGGRVSISTLLLQNPQIYMDLARMEKSDSELPVLPMEKIFSTLDLIPIREVLIQSLQFGVEDSKQKASVKIVETDASVLLMTKLIDLRLKTGEIQTTFKNHAAMSTFRASTHARIEPERLLIEDFVVAFEKSQINLQGSFVEPELLLREPKATLRTHVRVDLPELFGFLKSLMPEQKIPALEGEVKSIGKVDLNSFSDIKGDASLITSNIKIDKFYLGDVRTSASYQNKKLSLAHLALKHPSGLLEATGTTLSLADNMSFATTLKTGGLDLRKFTAALALDIPVDSNIAGKFDCSGNILENPKLECRGSVDVKNSKLFNESPEKTTELLSLQSAQATGSVSVDSKAVRYQADVQVGENHGKSDGVIDFETGFLINYETPRLDFANVENLFNLKFEGWTSVKGHTQGDSHAATANMALSGEQLWFENYFISKMQTDLEYKAGHVTLENVKGSVNNTLYEGKIGIDLDKGRIAVNAGSSFFEAKDFLQIFSRRVQLPFEITGTGNAQVTVEGPFAFNELSYILKSSIYRGSVAGESFDKAFFDVTSKNGEVNADRVEMHKRQSLLTLTGKGHPDGNIEALIDGSKFRLEESENVSKISSGIIGLLNFKMSLTGYVLAPESTLKGTLSEAAIEDQPLPNSAFAIRLGKETIEGSANIIGNRVQSEFIWPLTPTAPFKMKIRTLDWNFASFFGILTGSTLKDEYQAAVTSQIDLEAPSGGILKSTGEINISRIFLRRGQIGLQNNLPLKITMHNGSANIENFNLAGDQSVLSITGKNFTSENLNFAINGRTDLRLLQIFVPFLEDLGGPMSLSLKVTGPISRPEILGSAFAQDAFVKLKGFPHVFEKAKIDVLFSHSKILINSVRAQLAGGTMQADGSVEFKGLRNFDTNVRARLEGVSLNVPEGIKTTGNADIQFTGSWFPFLLSGTYTIANGLVEKEFESEPDAKGTVKQSPYLPKVILEDAFEPLVMDLNLILGENLRIKNSMVDGKVEGHLRVQGPPSNPVLLGAVSTIAPTNAILRDKVFEVLTANVNFNNPTEINPEMYISARSRIKEYDVSLLVQGTAKNMQFRFTSQPPLPEKDIISLLALGVTSKDLDTGIQGSAQEQQTAYQLGAAVLSNTSLNRELQQRLGVEVKFSSSFDEARGVAVPKFTLTRKLSPRLSAEASRSFGQQTSNEFKLDYLINTNVSAIGSWEDRERAETGTLSASDSQKSILGLDLVYKVEFK